MNATFHSLEWKKGGKSEFITCKPGEKRPSSSFKEYSVNSDGTIVYKAHRKSEYILTLKTDDGRYISEDVYGVIKYFNYNVRITKKFRSNFEFWMSQGTYSIDANLYIRGIYPQVRAFFKEATK